MGCTASKVRPTKPEQQRRSFFDDTPLSDVVPEEQAEKFGGDATVGTLRKAYGDDARKWRAAVAAKKIPRAVAKQAEQHVLWSAAVDHFFAWKGVTYGSRLCTWEDLAALDNINSRNDAKRCHRAKCLLQGDLIHPLGTTEANSVPHLLDALDAFTREHPQWNADGAYVLYRDYRTLRNFPLAEGIEKDDLAVSRIQHSGLSYTHAGAVVQHVVVALNSGGTEHGMLNVAKYFVQFCDNFSVCRHVVDNVGGSSLRFMRDIMGLKMGDVARKGICSSILDVADHLRQYGIGLVSSFRVEPAFLQDGTSYHGTVTKRDVGRHAMAVVGHREEGGTHHFLLQNWWAGKQFVEVSEEYLDSSGASVSFVTAPVCEIHAKYPTVSGAYAMEMEDLGESVLEGPLTVGRDFFAG